MEVTMPWTEITRAQYRRDGLRFASDMTDAEWALIARRLPPRRRLGRPRKTDLRKVVEAMLYILPPVASGALCRATSRRARRCKVISTPGATAACGAGSSVPWCGGRAAPWGAV